MKLLIDNHDGRGAQDFTASIAGDAELQIVRKLNEPSKLTANLVGNPQTPTQGARLSVNNGAGVPLFTGYVDSVELHYLGWNEAGSVYRCQIVASSDESLLDHKALESVAPFVNRTPNSAVQQLAQDVAPNLLSDAGLMNIDTAINYAPDAQKSFSKQAGEIASTARSAYSAINGQLNLAPIGAVNHTLNESDSHFVPEGLQLVSQNALANDVTILGEIEPQA